MRMSNSEIISMACAMNGITEEVHTFQRWKSMGFSVKKGEKAVFKAAIWKAVQKKDGENGENELAMFMKNSAFFTASQVQPIA